ncbi:MAG: D-TA family PLP-dependent enzyme, partial [bacterium]|nr:D-TA family PLP-dependent enzyme [bacterium]
YPVIGSRKLERLMPVAGKTRLTVALDSLTAGRELSGAARKAGVTIGILAEMDVGLGRVGVQPGDELLELARGLDRLPGLRLEGLAFYPGHIKGMGTDGERALGELGELVSRTVEEFDRAGLCRDIVSGGSTPTLFHSHEVRGLNEIRPGTYIFNDRNTVACGAANIADCAASILVTVVSTARKDGMMIDGGSKTFFSDKLVTGADDLFGQLMNAPGARFFRMNEEHGYVDLSESEAQFRIGDRVRVIPNHICVAVNLHEWVYGIRGETVEQVWKVDARGKLQ